MQEERRKSEISVIIPMYNCEEFVHELLDTFADQSFKDFELICVIDGATDRTEEIVAAFCNTDKRFQYVVQENLGAGEARNTGLEIAKGKYVIWVDADDMYSDKLLKELYLAAEKSDADIAMCLAEMIDFRLGTKKDKHGFDTGVFPNGAVIKPEDLKILRTSIDVGIQYKMFKKSFVEKNRLRFSHTYVSNDWFFDHASRISADRIVAVHKKLVTYRKHINKCSITSNRGNHIEDSIKVTRELWQWLKDNHHLPKYKDYFISAFDGALGYNIRFGGNAGFTDAIVKTINEDEPWAGMDTPLLMKSLRLSIGGENRFIKMYEDLIRGTVADNDINRDRDNEERELSEYVSALRTIRNVKELSAQKYGRSFKDMPKVSVVIPVYNVEKYIETCIDSLKKQSLKEMEFIFVDDGSTDDSLSKVESFSKEDNRVRIFSNVINKGPGMSRNHGIDLARGEYISFMDSDDYVGTDFYERLYRKAKENNGHDIAKGVRQKVSDAGELIVSDCHTLNEKIKTELKKEKPLCVLFSFEHQTAIFRHGLFDDGDARYGNTLKAEDVTFLFKICNKTNDIVFDEDAVYYYVQRSGSLSIDASFYVHLDGLKALDDVVRFIRKKRKINQYDYKYLTGKLSFRYEAYKSEMRKYPELKDKCDEYCKALLSVINLTEDPKIILDSNEEFRRLSIISFETGMMFKNKTKELEKNNPEVSVVIPMYNCGDFVNGVLSMFARQRFTDFEVICVIDGATDNTEKLVSAFCESDLRFRYTVRENGGPGAARNSGLDMAEGKYIIFSDADDEYSEDYLFKLYDIAFKHDAQIAICRFTEKNNISKSETIRGFDEKLFHENTVYSHDNIENIFVSIKSNLQNKLFNLDFVRENKIRFPETRVSEDPFFIYAALSVADRILMIHDSLSNYRLFINPDSITGKRARFQHESVDSLRLFYGWLKEHSLLDIHLEDYLRKVNSVLTFTGAFEVTPRFVAEFAHMLNKEEPFSFMTSGEILNYLKEGLTAEYAARRECEINNNLGPKIIESDVELSFELKAFKNRIHTAELLRQVSKDMYGRDFQIPESIPFAQ